MKERLQHFEAFLRDEGITFDETSIRFAKSKLQGLGVIARRSIKVGAVVSTIPKTAILSNETSSLWTSHKYQNDGAKGDKAHRHRDQIAEEVEHSRDRRCPPIFQLPAAVLFETIIGDSSRWARYLAVLPRSLSEIGVPLAEPEKDITAHCKGTGVDVVSRRMRKNLREAFREFVRPLILERALDFGVPQSVADNLQEDQFFLAFAWVTSRAFEVDKFHGNSLVPIADMFNHKTDGEHVHIEGASNSEESDESESSWGIENPEDDGMIGMPKTLPDSDTHRRHNGRDHDGFAVDRLQDDKDESDNNLRIVCVRDVEANEEIFNTFGQKTSAILYLNYGFTEESNSYETALVHRSEVEKILEQFSRNVRDPNCMMTTKRRRCIEAASVVVYDDVLDDFFQITADGTFCHGIMLLIYLHAASWKMLEPFCDDEVEFLNHISELTATDIMDEAGQYALHIAGDIVEQQLRKIPTEAGGNADSQSLAAARATIKPLEKHSLRIRMSQRSVLKNACNALRQTVFRKKSLAISGANIEDPVLTEISEPKPKRLRMEPSSDSNAS